jgi:hypothetical protein
MTNVPEDKICMLEKMLEQWRYAKKAAFIPGTDAETPAEDIFAIVAERFGEDQANAMKKLRARRGACDNT